MYQGSQRHRENYLKAAALGTLAQNAMHEERMRAYYENPKKCMSCEQSIPYEKRNENKFCQKSCSASFNNRARGQHSQETKEKIAASTKKAAAEMMRRNLRPKAKKLSKTCSNCKKFFEVRAANKKQLFCTQECRVVFHRTDEATLDKARKIGRENVQKQMTEGRWKGWSGQGEDVRSYPEQYIEAQICKLGLAYTFQKQAGRFKVDFFFEEKQIALEVDGKQHEYPAQKESDKRKDDYLRAQGWKVFRIKWESVKKDSGRQRVQQQIEQLKQMLTA